MAKRAEIPEGATAKELIAALRARGVKPPSRYQLRRWDALLPKAPSIRTGRRGRPKIRYGLESIDRVELIMGLRAGQRMRLETIKFELWWHGFDADLPSARHYMVRTLKKRLEGIGITRSGSADPFDVAEEVIADLKSARIRNSVLRLAVRRLGHDFNGFLTGVHALIVFMLGGEPVWEDDQAGAEDQHELWPSRAVAKLMGFERAASDVLPDGARLLVRETDVRELLIGLRESGAFDIRDASAPVLGASPAELRQARDDAYVFGEVFPVAVRAIEHAFGRDFAGLGIFTVLSRLNERYFRVLVTLMMLVTRRALGGEGIDEINKALNSEYSRFAAYLSVIDHFPQYAQYYKADQKIRIRSCSKQFVDKMRLDVGRYLEQNPEIKQALSV